VSRFIRWQGIASFFVVMALIIVFVYLFADSLVKKGIEKSGELYLGAEINVSNVEITYSPLTLNIEGLQATDPKKPTHNLVSFSQASAGIDVWQYLFGKIYISELNVDQLRIDQPRESEGRVYILVEENAEQDGEGAIDSALTNLDSSLPTVDELLNNSDLLTVKNGKALQQSYLSEKEKLAGVQKSLPNKETLANYKKQITALSNTKVSSLADIEKLSKEFKVLKKQFSADRDIVKQAKQQVSSSREILSQQTKALKDAPQADWKNIESKYQLESLDGADFAHMLFGEQAREYFGYAETVYQHLAPLVGGSKVSESKENTEGQGRYVHFTDEEPMPDVLIEQAKFSLVLPQGEFAINGKELTHQHWMRGNSSIVNVVSDNIQGSGKLALALEFSLDQKQALSSNGKWQLEQVDLNDISLQNSSDLNLQLNSGLLSGDGTFSLLNEQLDSKSNLNLANTKYSGEGSSHLSTLLINTVRSLESLALTISAKGKISDPELSISSPLDSQLKKSMMKQVSTKLTSFKTDVKEGLNTKLTDALGLSNKEEQSFMDLEALVNDSGKALDNLMNSDVVKAKKKEFEDKQKKKLEDKMKKKLGKLFG
jgi:uncharacterized protein (TIGR03545 family)